MALITTTQQIILLRRGAREVDAARKFLSWISTENVVLLALLADAGQEAIALIRALDMEDAPTEDPFLLDGLLQRITMLFVDGEARHCGHTHFVLELLRKCPILVHGIRGVNGVNEMPPKIVGNLRGVPQAVVDRVLGHSYECMGQAGRRGCVGRISGLQGPEFLQHLQPDAR